MNCLKLACLIATKFHQPQLNESTYNDETKAETLTDERGETGTRSDVISSGHEVQETGNEASGENGSAETRILETYFIDKDDQPAQIQVS